MKNFSTFLISFCISFSVFAQPSPIEGSWYGLLKVQGMEITVVFNITQTDDGLKATMDSPDQGAFGIPVDKISFESDRLEIAIPSGMIVYTGMLKEDIVEGTFTQGGFELPLDLSREKPEKTAVKRPQDPTEPFPYHAEDVYFRNEKADITLAGTLTLPKKQGPFPAVVMITGSGPQNRDEEILGHRPFLVIADHLTRNGIAVLRFDDRGVAESEGDFASATSWDFVTDVEAAVSFLRTRPEIDRAHIGLMGHSEGGIIAPIVASRNPDNVGFIVLLAGTGVRGDKLLLEQQRLIFEVMDMSAEEIERNRIINTRAFEMIQQIEDTEILKPALQSLLTEKIADSDIPSGLTRDMYLQQLMAQTTNPWMLTFLRLDPAPYLEKVQCPVLAVNGSNDLQVPPSNLQAIEAALNRGGNHHVTVKEFPGLNHLFQECETGAPSNYATIEQTFAPQVLEKMSSWITGITNP
ncbi:MAG: alpha/beta fold hydrolase [Bacteroidetes bacterium]|nr:MAG: alpha/beta fold hydrolase [Bacteroidota bacterium]